MSESHGFSFIIFILERLQPVDLLHIMSVSKRFV